MEHPHVLPFTPRSHTRPMAAPAARVAPGVDVFEHLFEEHVSLCVWERPADPAVAATLQQIAPAQENFTARLGADPDLERELPGVFRSPALVEEIAGLVDLFSTLADTKSVGLRLLTTHSQPCPRFHRDRVAMRLICTWTGAGTEWLHESDLLPSAPTAGGTMAEQHIRPGSTLRQVPAFAVGVFKGELWPGGTRILHRSPPLPAGQWRAMVTLDEL